MEVSTDAARVWIGRYATGQAIYVVRVGCSTTALGLSSSLSFGGLGCFPGPARARVSLPEYEQTDFFSLAPAAAGAVMQARILLYEESCPLRSTTFAVVNRGDRGALRRYTAGCRQRPISIDTMNLGEEPC